MPSAEAPTSGRVTSKVARASAPERDFWPERARSSFFCELLLAAEQVLRRGSGSPRGSISAVCEARIPSLRLLLALAEARRVLADHERGLAAGAELGVDGGDDDVDVGDAAVGDEDLGPVQDPLVAVALGGRLQALDVGAGLRLGDRVGAELDLVAGAEAIGNPARDLLGSARGGDTRRRQPGAGDRERDAGAAPVQLLGRDHRHLAVGVAADALHVLEALKPLLARLLDDLPGDALLCVVLAAPPGGSPRGRTSGSGLLELELLVVKCEVQFDPLCSQSAGRRVD